MFFLKKKRENENIETTLKEYLSQTSDMYRQENSATGEILDRIQNEQADECHHKVQQDPAQELAPVHTKVVSHDYSSPFFRVETM